MNKKKVIIIGAGVAGLSAGCYLQINGYSTGIFEAHSAPGGLFTSWERNGYVIEGCVHGLLGSSPAHPLYGLWNELVDMDDMDFIDPDVKTVIEFEDKSRFIYHSRLDTLEEYLLEIAPEDAAVIKEFIDGVRTVKKLAMNVDKPRELYTPADYAGMLKYARTVPFMNKWNNISAEDFSGRFKNPILRRVFKLVISPVLFEMFVLAEMDQKRSGYPVCGSGRFAGAIARRYSAWGGKISYNSRVSSIMVQNGRAVGVVLENGEIHNADIVISAADAKSTLYKLLDGRYVDGKTRKMFERGEVNTSKIQVSLGLNRLVDDVGASVTYVLDNPFRICDGSEFDSINVLVYKNMRDQIPEGKTLLCIQLETAEPEYWCSLRETDRKEYMRLKLETAEKLADILEAHMGPIKGSLDMVDVATPATYIRYTGNWKGSTQGWSNKKLFGGNILGNTLPGLESFYMIGQWVKPGAGVPNVFMGGRNIAQIICKKDKKQFTTA